MESLAADLPMNNLSLGDKSSVSDQRNGGLKRSYTVLHHGRSSTQNHKPPLPKLSSPNLGNLSSPVISTSQTSVNILAGISNNSNSNSNNHANLMNSDTSSTGSNHSSVTSAN